MPAAKPARQATKISLRPYTPEDLEALYEIDQACYAADVAYSRAELRAYLRFPNADCLMAVMRGKLVGFCLTAHRENRGHIITIDVLEAYRRHKIGSRLLEAVESHLAKSGVREVILETATENHSAIAFWEKHGYRTRGIWKGYYPGGRDAYAMIKSIA
ncbi:MAG TPA: GNAT family N-acetyltransferase [Candidatus Dormibacteraeota bacterium]|nr:GNAT family N-acetyltransferase [Candidatus Dormibacteraeota bacterium]